MRRRFAFQTVVLLFVGMMLISASIAVDMVSAAPDSDSTNSPEPGSGNWHYGAYLDVGYTLDSNNPENKTWRSKSTTFKLGEPKINMINGYVRKDATPESRWGMEFGLQAGVDVDGLVTSPPPPAKEPVTNAETLKHFPPATCPIWCRWETGSN